MTAIALAGCIGEFGADLIPRRRRRMPHPFESDYTFTNLVDRVFLDAQTSRLARALGNSPRNAQKWVAGHEGAPPHAREFIDQQIGVLNSLKPLPYLEIQSVMNRAMDAGLHPEAMASILSKLYEELTGKTIR